jgi:ABC-type glycerol-3-phosphate transport system substrate-binding protein
MKRAGLLMALIATAALAAACGDNSAGGDGPLPDSIKPHTVNLPDGRNVLCVFESNGYPGGLSCDWSNAR